MDYPEWELARQRAALRALLGGGGPEEERDAPEENAVRKEAAAWERNTVRGGSAPPDGRRRSPAGPGEARRRGTPGAGRYAGGDGGTGESREAGAGFPEDFPEAWEAVRGKPFPWEEGGAWEMASGGGAVPLAREPGKAEADGPGNVRRGASEGAQGPAREGTGLRPEPGRASGGREVRLESRETAEGTEAGAEAALEAAGAGPAGEHGETPRAGEGSFSRLSQRADGGGETAGETSAAIQQGGTVPDGGGGPAWAVGRTLSRTLPWGGGESAALRAEREARALSRAVQRDARRYDGGFTIY